MAYNPFNIFRRNQKALFAVITVFIMFTFVLSSGLGGGADFFDWLPGWLSKKGNKGEHLATIDGTKVYDRELRDLRFQRVMANRFMDMAAAQSVGNLRKYVADQASKVSPEHRQAFQLAANLLGMLEDPQMMFTALQFGGQLLTQVEAITRNPTAKDEDKELARAVMLTFELAQRRLFTQGQYFINAPNRNQRDLIDFMLWDKKAKQLGIEFSTDDVKRLIQAEFMNQFRDDTEIRKVLQKDMQGFTLEKCLDAIATEFRVRAAQTALMGPVAERPDRTLTAAPIFNPPYELFTFYREKSSPSSYEVLAVPGAAFQPSGSPTDDEIKRLYADYANDEPNPAKETPGFKEPRKIKLEWVEATGSEPYYKKAAAEALSHELIVAAMIPPGGSPWLTIMATPYVSTDPLLRQKYDTEVVERHRSERRNKWGTSGFVTPYDVLGTSVLKARTPAVIAGGLVGSLVGFGGAYQPYNQIAGSTIAAEQRDRIVAGLPLFLGTIPGPGMFGTTIGAEAQYRSLLPEPAPFELYRPEMFQALLDKKAYDMAVADLRKLRDEVTKLTKDGKEKDLGPAKAYIAEFVKVRGLKTGESKNLESEWTIGDDPGLQPLKAVAQNSPHGGAPIQFGKKFFFSEGAPQMGIPAGPTKGTYKPEFYPAEPRPDQPELTMPGQVAKRDSAILTWRMEDVPAKGIPLHQARPKVVEAWKRIKGREAAQRHADAIAADIRARQFTSADQVDRQLKEFQKDLDAKFTDPKDKEKVKLFRLDNIAPIPNSPGFGMPGMGGRGFALTPSADIPYPTKEMEKVLLDERMKDPDKTVFVLPDQPKDTYYVMVLTERRVLQVSDFQRDVYGAAAGMMGNPARETVLRAHATDAVKKARDSIMTLIKKEFNYVETDEQKKKIDDKDRNSDEG